MSDGNNSITIGEVTESLNEKMDRDLSNIDLQTFPSGIDYVVEWQVPTAENSYTWYRKYISGWVEQGGKIVVGESPTTTTHTIILPVAMADTDYNLTVEGISGDGTSNTVSVQYGHAYYGAVWNSGKTTTSFNYRAPIGGCWEVKGMAAA